jgi:hypothetical protein
VGQRAHQHRRHTLNAVEAEPDHFSQWAVLEDAYSIFVPLTLRGY